MKTKIFILLLVLTSISVDLNAQIKIFTGGVVSVGNTIAPLYSNKFQVWGNTIFCPSSSPSSAAYIRGNSAVSSATTPEYTWLGNDQLGLFHPASNVIGFTSGGVERMRLTYNALQINSSGDWNKCIWVNATTANACGYHLTYNSSDKFYVTASGGVYAYGYYTLSDSTLKQNIHTLTNSLDKIKLLRGVSFNYKPEVQNPNDSITVLPTASPSTQIGLIAQEVENTVPEVVITLQNGKKAVEYQSLVGLLIEAMKEQQQEITQLQSDLINCCTHPIKSNQKTSNPNADSSNAVNSTLFQNSPNPFKESTTIKYYLSSEISKAVIYIFNMQGTLLKSYDILTTGDGSLKISGGELTAGMYMYSLVANGKEIDTKRMILTK